MYLGYIYSVELFSLILMGAIFVVMRLTNPKKDELYKYTYFGVVLSIICLLDEVAMSVFGKYTDRWAVICVAFCMFIFLALFPLINIFIMRYLFRLSSNSLVKKDNKKFYEILYVVYLAVAILLIHLKLMYRVGEENVELTGYVYYYAAYGIVVATLCFINALINRKWLPHIIYVFNMFFAAISIILWLIQIQMPEKIFSSLTYVLPVLMFYMIFHHYPFDQISGCQEAKSFASKLKDIEKRKENQLLVWVYLPRLEQLELDADGLFNKQVFYVFATICRKIERITIGTRIYRYDDQHFVVCFPNNKPADELLDNISNIVYEAYIKTNSAVEYKMAAYKYRSDLEEAKDAYRFAVRLINKIIARTDERLYVAEEEDYAEFKEDERIKDILLDIRAKMDYDDERVIVNIQPIYSVADGKFKTGEALMRLHDGAGFISPTKFVPIAEASDCIHPLTLIMLHKICKLMKGWRKKYDLDAITINFSAYDFYHIGAASEIISVLDRYGIKNNQIRIELTESLSMESSDAIDVNIEALRESGMAIYLDDFGTGYSNFYMAMSKRYHTVKFDKTMLYRAMEDRATKTVLKDFIKLFKNKGARVLIEGVETEKQFEFAKEVGFEYIQGFYFSKPVVPEIFEKYLDKK